MADRAVRWALRLEEAVSGASALGSRFMEHCEGVRFMGMLSMHQEDTQGSERDSERVGFYDTAFSFPR